MDNEDEIDNTIDDMNKTTLQQPPLSLPKPSENIMVLDTGGGNTSTITSRSCLVLHKTNHVTKMTGYQDKNSPQRLPIVHCAVKAYFKNVEQPVILLLNYVTLVTDEHEEESLLQPFGCMRHGVMMDLVPIKYEGNAE